ncbi:hypothetical protein KC799_16855 [candidate division KSB1 bacterium]|nr:hypothetical protein [candidate division KSB1 bacterium]
MKARHLFKDLPDCIFHTAGIFCCGDGKFYLWGNKIPQQFPIDSGIVLKRAKTGKTHAIKFVVKALAFPKNRRDEKTGRRKSLLQTILTTN